MRESLKKDQPYDEAQVRLDVKKYRKGLSRAQAVVPDYVVRYCCTRKALRAAGMSSAKKTTNARPRPRPDPIHAI